jgi:predicted outer membrane repeat protein/parallel beta-helix repeat protein
MPTITDAVSIDGTNSATSNNVTVQVTTPGTSNFRVFYIDASGETISIGNMTIQGGDVSGESNTYGGSIYISDGTVYFNDVTISNGKASRGGGIYGNSFTMTNSTISSNTATSQGGAIYGSSFTITNCTVSGNTSENYSGGIYCDNSCTLNRCTISGNNADSYAGGVYFYYGTNTITNCTIANNYAGTNGGGIIVSSSGTIILTNCTVTGNSAGSSALWGAGISSNSASIIYSTNSIIAYNYNDYNDVYDDYDGGATTVYGSYNISPLTSTDWGSGSGNIEYTYTSGQGSTLFDSYTTITENQTYQPVLADNGGDTETILLASSGSIAASAGVVTGYYDDAGTTKYAFSENNGSTWNAVEDGSSVSESVTEITIDQRSYLRNDPPSIGAYEHNGILPVELTSFTAELIDEGIKLTWQTATEVNNYGFQIQRKKIKDKSENSWEDVGFVNGHGNSNSPKSYSYTDTPTGGTTFKYRLKQIDFDGAYEYSDAVEVTLGAITEYSLEQNYPNPFNPTTSIKYQVANNGNVTLKVYDMLGREVGTLVNETLQSGIYTVEFNASQLASGVYIYKLRAGDYVSVKKLMLLK